MDEILPGLFHWTAHHDGIGMEVSSFYVAGEAATLIDPMLPEEGVDAVAALGRPQAIVLTSRHHLRHSERLADAFGCPILCQENGLHEFEDGGPPVRGFCFGETLRPGIEAAAGGAISAEDAVLHIAVGGGALAFADAIIHYGGRVGFVPESLLGEDPEAVRRAIRASVAGVLERDFDTVLFAHGDPIVGEGREALRRLVDEGPDDDG